MLGCQCVSVVLVLVCSFYKHYFEPVSGFSFNSAQFLLQTTTTCCCRAMSSLYYLQCVQVSHFGTDGGNVSFSTLLVLRRRLMCLRLEKTDADSEITYSHPAYQLHMKVKWSDVRVSLLTVLYKWNSEYYKHMASISGWSMGRIKQTFTCGHMSEAMEILSRERNRESVTSCSL